MTPLPAALGGTELVAWRLDHARFAPAWDSGEGAFQVGGRWNRRGVRIVYCSLDPATALLEVAVHKGFRALDIAPHVLTSLTVVDPARVHIVPPEEIPDDNWRRPGLPSAEQQAFGDALLSQHPFVVIPSAVSAHSWNLLIAVPTAEGAYTMRGQEPFVLDPRLHPPAP